MKLQPNGQNIIIRPIKQYDETWYGEITLSSAIDLPIGTKVFYPDNYVKYFNIPHNNGVETFHVIWSQHIFATTIEHKIKLES